MNISDDEAGVLRDFMNHPGYALAIGILESMKAEARDEVMHTMAHKPETLTGRTAIKYAARAAALQDYREELEGTQRRFERK